MNRPMPLTLDDCIKLNKQSVSLEPVIYDIVDISSNGGSFLADWCRCNYYDDCYCEVACSCDDHTWSCACDDNDPCNCDHDCDCDDD